MIKDRRSLLCSHWWWHLVRKWYSAAVVVQTHPEIEAILSSLFAMYLTLEIYYTYYPSYYRYRRVTRVYCGGVKINSCCMKLHFVSLYDACMMHDLFFTFYDINLPRLSFGERSFRFYFWEGFYKLKRTLKGQKVSLKCHNIRSNSWLYFQNW